MFIAMNIFLFRHNQIMIFEHKMKQFHIMCGAVSPYYRDHLYVQNFWFGIRIQRDKGDIVINEKR